MNLEKNILFVFIFMVTMSSCDALTEYNFLIHNNTPNTITVQYTVNGKDSIQKILPNETKTIYKYSEVGSAYEDMHKDNFSLFQKLEILSNNRSKEYTERKLWKVKWKGKHTVLYSIDFKLEEL